MIETPSASGWRGAFLGMLSEGHAGAEDESAAEDEGEQRKKEHGGHEEDELKHGNHLRPFDMSMM